MPVPPGQRPVGFLSFGKGRFFLSCLEYFCFFVIYIYLFLVCRAFAVFESRNIFYRHIYRVKEALSSEILLTDIFTGATGRCC